MGNVIVSKNLQKTSERINLGGQVIDPKTKRVLKPMEKEYVPQVEVIQPAPKVGESVGEPIGEPVKPNFCPNCGHKLN